MVRAHVPQSAHFKAPASQQNQDQRDQQQQPPDEQQASWAGGAARKRCTFLTPVDRLSSRSGCARQVSKLPAVCGFGTALEGMLGYCCFGPVLRTSCCVTSTSPCHAAHPQAHAALNSRPSLPSFDLFPQNCRSRPFPQNCRSDSFLKTNCLDRFLNTAGRGPR